MQGGNDLAEATNRLMLLQVTAAAEEPLRFSGLIIQGSRDGRGGNLRAWGENESGPYQEDEWPFDVDIFGNRFQGHSKTCLRGSLARRLRRIQYQANRQDNSQN
jgi:hypothetical protein